MIRRGAGFTLIEIMVALGVFALISITVYARIGEILAQTRALESRTLATWVARNRLAALRLEQRGEEEAPAPGRRTDLVTLGGRNWRVDIDMVRTSTDELRRVDLAVTEDGAGSGPDAAVARVSGFLGRN